MVTTVVKGRKYSFSHALGHNSDALDGFKWPTALCLGKPGEAYVVNRGNEYVGAETGGMRISRIAIGKPGEKFICFSEFEKLDDQRGLLVWPTSVAMDREGRAYAADEALNHICIFDENANFVSKWGKSGSGDGEFNGPSGLAFDREDNLYVVDSMNHRVQKFTKDGDFLLNFGEEGSCEGQFKMPWGITIDSQGDIYIADWKNHRVQKFTPDGDYLASFGTYGTGDGELNHPTDVAVDPEGDVYVADWANQRVQVFTPDGEAVAILKGEAPMGRGRYGVNHPIQTVVQITERAALRKETTSPFIYPIGLVFDAAESRLLVVDCLRNRLQIYTKEKN